MTIIDADISKDKAVKEAKRHKSKEVKVTGIT